MAKSAVPFPPSAAWLCAGVGCAGVGSWKTMMPGFPVLLLAGSRGYCATGMNMLPWIGSTARVEPPRPAQAAPTSVGAGASAVPAAKTPTTGKTFPAFVAGQRPPLLVLEPDPV